MANDHRQALNGAEVFIRALENEGVKYIFAVPGEENLAFLEALRNSSIRLVLNRHEQAAGFMAARLAAGMRAVSVAISPETGAGGFILPGDRVDVIVTREERSDTGGNSKVFSDTVLANVRVLAIDQTFGQSEDGSGEKIAIGKTATLELTPAQAETLARSQALGDIWLSLRSIADSSAGGPVDTGALAAAGNRRNSGGAVTVVRYGVTSIEQPRSGR